MNKLSDKSKKVLRIIYTLTDILLCALIVAGAGYAAYLYFGNKEAAGLASEYEAVSENGSEKFRYDEQGEIYFFSDEEFRVLIISDMKLGAGRLSLDNDRKTLDALYKLISVKAPDLVIINGGVPLSEFSSSGRLDNLSGIRLLISFMKKINVCWAASPVVYVSDFYNNCIHDTADSLYGNTASKLFSRRNQSKAFGGIENTSAVLTGVNGEVRLAMAVLDFSANTPDNIGLPAHERWIFDWTKYVDSGKDLRPSGKNTADFEKYVISPYEVTVPDEVTLILPEKADYGEHFSHREIIIKAVQTEQQ